MLAWHVLDGADGKVARATGTSSPLGRLIDGICDHLVFGAVYIAFAVHLSLSGMAGGSAMLIWLMVSAAGVSHALQAAGYERRRSDYARLVARGGMPDAPSAKTDPASWTGILERGYARAQSLVDRPSKAEEAMRRIRLDTAQTETVRQRMIDEAILAVRKWSLLNANNRTIALAIFALLGLPFFYFLYEVVILNGLLAWLLIWERRRDALLARQIGALSAP
jgi:hypothetical protein